MEEVCLDHHMLKNLLTVKPKFKDLISDRILYRIIIHSYLYCTDLLFIYSHNNNNRNRSIVQWSAGVWIKLGVSYLSGVFNSFCMVLMKNCRMQESVSKKQPFNPIYLALYSVTCLLVDNQQLFFVFLSALRGNVRETWTNGSRITNCLMLNVKGTT